MQHYRRKYLVINIVITLLFVAFTVMKFPYIKTGFMGKSPLDIERFSSETGTVVIDELIELGRKDEKIPSNACFRTDSYWQGNNYLFEIKADSVEDTGKVFTQTIQNGISASEVVDMYRIYLAEAGGKKVAVLALSREKVTENMTGYVTKMSKPIKAALSETLRAGESLEVCEYIFDIRGVEMDVARTDFASFWLYIALLVFLWAKLIIQYKDPKKTPTYRQLIKYGDIETVEEDVNAQFENAQREKNKLVLEDYILEKDTFKLKVVRNHTNKH